MKRNENMVPEFDEIIFENRNKSYGAYDIRKHYKSATSISVLGGVFLCSALLIAVSLKPEKVIANEGPKQVIITVSDPFVPVIETPPEAKAPPELVKPDAYVAPVVTSDTTVKTDFLGITDDYLDNVRDGVARDSVPEFINSEPIIPVEEKILIFVDETPEYPGGLSELMKFVGENLDYPTDAIANNIQGRVVLKFVVNKDGSVDRIEVINSIDPLLDAEAIRVVGTLPKFKPGKQGGVPVPVWFILPVLFRLQ